MRPFLAMALAMLLAPDVRAGGLGQLAENLQPGDPAGLQLHGYLRVRGDTFVNLDLDRGLTPSGAAFFPVPLGDPLGQTLYGADARLRVDLTLTSEGGGFAVRLRTDVLDNIALGSAPEGRPPSRLASTPAATTTQRAPGDAFRIKRAYGEARTPLGLLAAGRMGNGWGLGMLANSGDCASCDLGDAADRVVFATPLLGHVIITGFDLSATGPQTQRTQTARAIDLEPSDDVFTFTFALGSFENDATRARRRRAGRSTLEYGAYVSRRWQHDDVPADYLVVAQPAPLTRSQVMTRGYAATAVDGWLRLTLPRARVEVEGAALLARVDEPSLVPGVLYERPVTSRQLGAALETDLHLLPGALHAGLDAGYASGDAAPGFGAFPAPLASYPQAGELDGPQASPPHDRSIDNFRFHPDYQVDRILFRQIIGTVTDAMYVRPHATYVLAESAAGRLEARLALVASRAVEPASTPGGDAALGVELDPSLIYESSDGLRAALDYAYLWPLAGLDNPLDGRTARAAQLLELRVAFTF